MTDREKKLVEGRLSKWKAKPSNETADQLVRSVNHVQQRGAGVRVDINSKIYGDEKGIAGASRKETKHVGRSTGDGGRRVYLQKDSDLTVGSGGRGYISVRGKSIVERFKDGILGRENSVLQGLNILAEPDEIELKAYKPRNKKSK